MKLVAIESPYAGDVERNLRYLRACMADCLRRGEAPFASHGLYTQPGVLDDTKPEERSLGMWAGFYWAERADATVVYEDLGISRGMAAGIERAEAQGRAIERRRLGGEWAPGPRHCNRCGGPLLPAERGPEHIDCLMGGVPVRKDGSR